MRSRTDPFADSMRRTWSRLHELVRDLEDTIKHIHNDKLPRRVTPGKGTPISSDQTEYSSDQTEYMVKNSRPLGVEEAFQDLGTYYMVH
jgi:hypothetical protein